MFSFKHFTETQLLKKTIIILLILLPNMTYAFYGWRFKDFSFLAGQQYNYTNRPLWALELQYDRFSTSCTSNDKYFGFSANYSFIDNHYETGIKTLWNPSSIIFRINRYTTLLPYLFGQANFTETNTSIPNTNQQNISKAFIFRPGIGLTGYFRTFKACNIRAQLQFGYNILNENSFNIRNNGTLEFKLGIGIGLTKINLRK